MGWLLSTGSVFAQVNVALQANGGVATASSTFNSSYAPAGANNGDRKGLNWGNGGGWNDGTSALFPDWLQVNFSGTQSIGEIDVFTVQDNYATPVEPTPSLTFTLYGITAFQTQYWNGSAWLDVPGGNITGNNLVWRRITFAPVATNAIRVVVNAGLGGYSRITEVEAWTAQGVQQQTYFIHTDHLNTPRVITNNAGRAVWRWDNLDPFGVHAPDENPSGLGTFTCNLRLPGQYFDQETNLHYNYFRDYDPAIGRYVQSDPVGLYGGINTYAYVNSNPLSIADPLGLVGQGSGGGVASVASSQSSLAQPPNPISQPPQSGVCSTSSNYDPSCHKKFVACQRNVYGVVGCYAAGAATGLGIGMFTLVAPIIPIMSGAAVNSSCQAARVAFCLQEARQCRADAVR